MNQLNLVFVLLFLPFFGFAQEVENRAIRPFSGLKVSQGIEVLLKHGDRESVKVEANIKLSDVITEVSGDYLKIHLEDGKFRNVSVKVYVTYVRLEKIIASSAARVYGEDAVKSDELEISASSAAEIELELKVKHLEVKASSAADIELDGVAEKVLFDVSSAGEIDAYDLLGKNVTAEASSAGTIKLNVEQELEAEASSGASIRYRGNPSKSITNSSSGGSVKKSL